MARRVFPILFLVVAVVVAACRQPTAPAPNRALLRDTDGSGCVDTIYRLHGDSTETSSESGCHVVVIWY